MRQLPQLSTHITRIHSNSADHATATANAILVWIATATALSHGTTATSANHVEPQRPHPSHGTTAANAYQAAIAAAADISHGYDKDIASHPAAPTFYLLFRSLFSFPGCRHPLRRKHKNSLPRGIHQPVKTEAATAFAPDPRRHRHLLLPQIISACSIAIFCYYFCFGTYSICHWHI
jgi:hypothetical protein